MSALLHSLSENSTFRLNKESTACCCSSKCYAKLLLIETIIEMFTVLALEKDSCEKTHIDWIYDSCLYRSQPKIMDDRA